MRLMSFDVLVNQSECVLSLPAEPLLHFTSVLVPVLLWLLPASEYVLGPSELQRCSEHERGQCPLESTPPPPPPDQISSPQTYPASPLLQCLNLD